jgi:hypothetical protein
MRINNEQPLGGSHVHTPEHTAAQSLITMFERVPASYRNESTIAKERFILLARELRSIQEEKKEFPDTTDVHEYSVWHNRKMNTLTEVRELIADIQKEYETKPPFDITLVDDEHLTSTLRFLADISEGEI